MMKTGLVLLGAKMLGSNTGRAGTLEELPFVNEDQFHRFRFFCANEGVVLPIQLKIDKIEDREEVNLPRELIIKTKQFTFKRKLMTSSVTTDSIAIFNEDGRHLITSMLSWKQPFIAGDYFNLTYSVTCDAPRHMTSEEIERYIASRHFNIEPYGNSVGYGIKRDGSMERDYFRRIGGR